MPKPPSPFIISTPQINQPQPSFPNLLCLNYPSPQSPKHHITIVHLSCNQNPKPTEIQFLTKTKEPSSLPSTPLPSSEPPNLLTGSSPISASPCSPNCCRFCPFQSSARRGLCRRAQSARAAIKMSSPLPPVLTFIVAGVPLFQSGAPSTSPSHEPSSTRAHARLTTATAAIKSRRPNLSAGASLP